MIFLVLSSQASSRYRIVANTASALTAQKAFLNNSENVVNRRVDIWEDIKHYQETLSYGSITAWEKYLHVAYSVTTE